MSPLLRRLGVTRRRSRADLEHALEVAETDRDIARGERDRVRLDLAAVTAERECAYAALGKVAAAAGRPGAPTRWNVEDLVDWATAARKAATSRLTGRLAEATAWRRELLRQLAAETERAETLADQRDAATDQRDRVEAELLAVDEALAAAGVDWTDDRATGIRDLARLRDGGVLADDGVVDATIADARSLETGGGPVCGACGTPYPCPEHQPDALAAQRAEADPWCSADLDGARCSRPAGHTEPCRPVEPSPVGVPVAQCRATGEPVAGRCERVAGHPGEHEWAAV